MVWRYLRNAVAWIDAINFIVRGIGISPSPKDIPLDFIVMPLASPDICAPEHDFVNNGIKYMLAKLALSPALSLRPPSS